MNKWFTHAQRCHLIKSKDVNKSIKSMKIKRNK